MFFLTLLLILTEDARHRCQFNTWKIAFGNGRRSPLVMGNAPITDQVLQISQERQWADARYW
jgi:hypothetical protein